PEYSPEHPGRRQERSVSRSPPPPARKGGSNGEERAKGRTEQRGRPHSPVSARDSHRNNRSRSPAPPRPVPTNSTLLPSFVTLSTVLHLFYMLPRERAPFPVPSWQFTTAFGYVPGSSGVTHGPISPPPRARRGREDDIPVNHNREPPRNSRSDEYHAEKSQADVPREKMIDEEDQIGTQEDVDRLPTATT
ncbi:hypothetical protein FRC03_007306, partial [Tulasnella sp. 419]